MKTILWAIGWISMRVYVWACRAYYADTPETDTEAAIRILTRTAR